MMDVARSKAEGVDTVPLGVWEGERAADKRRRERLWSAHPLIVGNSPACEVRPGTFCGQPTLSTVGPVRCDDLCQISVMAR